MKNSEKQGKNKEDENEQEEEYNIIEKADIRQIYKKEKKSGFQTLEAKATYLLAINLNKIGNSVISLGGNTIKNNEAINCIKEQDLLIYLKEDINVLYERIIKKDYLLF